MLQEISISEYYQSYHHLPIIDVRSPGEYEKGHIPGAVNIALFSNEERADVGTTYLRKSRDLAMELGYKYVTPKLQDFIDQSRMVAPRGEVVIHCWRGGMRSQSFAKHIHDNGMERVYVITGGYKAFRNHVLDFFKQDFNLRVLGGYTGSGKTEILAEFEKMGLQVVDLERLANHKGSAFGAINQAPQPTVEQFENNLFNIMRSLNFQMPIWLEDESNSIGKVQIPMALFNQIRQKTLVFLDIPKEKRAYHLVKGYAVCDKSLLEKGINMIAKRLGGLATQQALEFLASDNFYQVALILLVYYDKTYLKGSQMRSPEQIVQLPLDDTKHELNAQKIIEYFKQNEHHQTNPI